MKNLIAIIAGEPNSINSELIAKSWKKIKKKKKYIYYWKFFFIKGPAYKIKIQNTAN